MLKYVEGEQLQQQFLPLLAVCFYTSFSDLEPFIHWVTRLMTCFFVVVFSVLLLF